MTARKPQLPTRRVNHGRGHSYYVDGVKTIGVTTIIGAALAKPALTSWAARTVAEYVADHRELLTAMRDAEIRDFLPGVPFRDREEAAARGTELHKFAAEYASSRTIDVPDNMIGLVDQYISFRECWHPAGDIVEQMVVSRKYRYAGTLDLICRLDGLGTTLIDVKTGRGGVYPETALQLAAYGMCDVMVDTDSGVDQRMPQIDSYAALWVSHDTWELVPFDVGERERRAFLYLAEIARWIWDRADSKKMTDPVRKAALDRPQPRLEVVR